MNHHELHPSRLTDRTRSSVCKTTTLRTLRARFLATPAPLTLDQAGLVERNVPAELEAGRTRQAALLLLTKSGAELAAMANDRASRESVEDLAVRLDDYCHDLAHLLELMDLASLRLGRAWMYEEVTQ